MNPHGHNGHRILSPACLPIPPLGRLIERKTNFSPFFLSVSEKRDFPKSFGINFSSLIFSLRAKNGTRTRDPDLGKVVLYQLSYFRIFVRLMAFLKTCVHFFQARCKYIPIFLFRKGKNDTIYSFGTFKLQPSDQAKQITSHPSASLSH